ncbi:MAG: FAD-dependent monooxygenase [Actinomycetota bacterium]|nr:FAD-dependent monooxygenase [Actinomycetota bacterium]
MKRGVVLGGSVAGLLVARVLTDHADEVVVVDRDDLPEGPVDRRGVPQGTQVHGLLARGLEQMEALLPGFTTELAEDGAEVADPGADLRWHVNGEGKPPAPIGPGVACTRPFLEWHLRRRIQALDGVRTLQARGEGLTAQDGRVDGVLLTEPGGGGGGQRLAADLVVDCTGRSSRIDEWLVSLGYEPPPRRTVTVDLGYASRFYPRRPDDLLDGARAVISITESLRRPRGAAAFPVEGGRWLVTVGAYHHDRPTSEPEDFAARLAEDPAPALHPFAGRDDALTDVATYRYPASVRRDYHRCPRLPRGLLAAGDAVASFNPLYGQGMTSAALHAATLGSYLGSGASVHAPAGSYFRRLRPVIDSVWKLSTSADFRLPHVTGDRPPGLWVTHRLTDLYTRATLEDADLHGLFLRVLNLQTRPEQLARPDHLTRAWRASRRRRRRKRAAAAS